MITIRKANYTDGADAAAIVALLSEFAEGPEAGGEGLPEYARGNLVRELAKRSTIHTFLAFVGGEAAGLAIVNEGFSTFSCKSSLNIHDYMVAARHRKKGVGTKLLQAVEDFARERNCGKLTLEVFEGNQRAIEVYRKFGFRNFELDPTMGKALFFDKKL